MEDSENRGRVSPNRV
jgi:hypothetical protein